MSARWVGRLEGPATILVVIAACLGATFGAASVASARTFIDSIGVDTSSLLVADYGVDAAGTQFAPLAPGIIDSAASDRGVSQPTLSAAAATPALAAQSAQPEIVGDEFPARPRAAVALPVSGPAPPLTVSPSVRPPSEEPHVEASSPALDSSLTPSATEEPAPTPTPADQTIVSDDELLTSVDDTTDEIIDTVDDTLEPATDPLDPTIDEALDPVESESESDADSLLGDLLGGWGGLFG